MAVLVAPFLAIALALGAVAAAPTGGAIPLASVPGTPTHPLAALAASIAASPRSGPPPLTVTLEAVVSGGVSPYVIAWQFGDGSPASSASNVTHTYATLGTFTVELNVTDNFGATTNASATISVVPAPLLLGAEAVPAVVERGGTVVFESSVSGGVPPYHYAWTGLPPGCPALDVENYSCQPTASGTYSVHVTVTDSLGASNQTGFLFVVTGTSASPSAANGAPEWPIVGLVVAVAGLAAVGGLLLGRRWRRGRRS